MTENNEVHENSEQKHRCSESALNNLVIFLRHLFGMHDSCCCVAGKWSLEGHKRIRHALCLRTNLPLIRRNAVRLWKYIFVRRLAITPYRALNDYENSNDKMLFEWQKMPGGYRWF